MELRGLQELIRVVAALRDPAGGCPWDRAQDHRTLMPYALEEVHEFLESLETVGADSPDTWEELGDVLFQVVLHSQLLAERKLTNLDDIADHTAKKLIERHPHVFDPNSPKFSTPEEVNRAWEQLKEKRRAAKPAAAQATPTRAARLKAIPRSLPSLQRAARIGEKAASFRFDWPDAPSVWAKVREEVGEFETATSEAHAQEEMGDLLFTLAQYARKRRWDPETLVNAATTKMLIRMERMEALIQQAGQDWDQLSHESLEEYWEKAKKHERE